MTAPKYEVPPGVLSALKAKAAAEVLNFDERQLVSWCRAGFIHGLQSKKNGLWWIPALEVARLAERMMIEPNWEKAL